MKHQTQNHIRLLFITPPGDETAAVRATLAQHSIIAMIPCEDFEARDERLPIHKPKVHS